MLMMSGLGVSCLQIKQTKVHCNVLFVLCASRFLMNSSFDLFYRFDLLNFQKN